MAKKQTAAATKAKEPEGYKIPERVPDLPLREHERLENGFKTPEFRVAFSSVWKPTSQQGSEPKYGLTALIPKERIAKWKPLKERALALVDKTGWSDKVKEQVKERIRNNEAKGLFRDGDETEYDGFPGCFYLGARNKYQPPIVDSRGRNGVPDPITEETDFYSGCWARMTVTLFAYGGKKGKDGTTIPAGIGVSIQGIQKLADDDAFSSRVNAQQEYDDYVDDSLPEFDNEGGGSGDVDLTGGADEEEDF